MGIRTRRAHMHSRTHIVGFGIVGFFGFIALLAAALAISLGALVSSWLSDLPDYQSADAYLVAEPTTVYASDDTPLVQFYLQNRRSVESDEVSDYVFKATVDVEDERFYKHNGVDPQGIVRAVFAQLAGGSEGASTITQQLVRNTVLSDEQFERSLKRKVREAYIAIQMEKTYTKDQILMMYLNTIYYGEGAYGIEAASITYFNKHASELTLNEAATLAGVPNSPSYYDPIVNIDAAKQRRNHVLDRMLAVGDITQEECDKTKAEDITLNPGSFTESTSASPYFTDYVRQLLLEDFDQDVILSGGLKVYTTLDLDMQKAAEEAVAQRLDEIGNKKLQSALVCTEVGNGYIRAMVGGKSYEKSQFNMATQARRQTGSSFKVFTLAAAIADGMSPDIYIDCNSPIQATPTWKVQNYGNTSYGTITLAKALAVSSNTGFAQVAVAIGADKIADTAHAMGVSVDLPAYPSLTLGTAGVPPVQMAEAYGTIAGGGIHRDAIAITRIEDRNGNVVYEHKDDPKQVLDAGVAQATEQVMEGVVNTSQGTANSMMSLVQFDQPIAGKTGTTEDWTDLWFCGITPQYSCAVWCGYEDNTAVYVDGTYGHPYNTACMIWAYFMNSALYGVERAEFPSGAAAPTYKSDSTWGFDAYPEEYEEDETTEAEDTAAQNAQDQQEEQDNQDNGDATPTTPDTPSDSNAGGTGNGGGATPAAPSDSGTGTGGGATPAAPSDSDAGGDATNG